MCQEGLFFDYPRLFVDLCLLLGDALTFGTFLVKIDDVRQFIGGFDNRLFCVRFGFPVGELYCTGCEPQAKDRGIHPDDLNQACVDQAENNKPGFDNRKPTLVSQF